jgi:hypothetical protein
MKSNLLLLIVFALSFSACEKEQNRQLLNAYFKFTVDGQEKTIKDGAGINDNTFECKMTGDTLLRIRVSKQYEDVGFYIKDKFIKDGTYVLDSLNMGYYTDPVDYRRYATNSNFKGNLTIKRGTFQAKDMLNTLEGQFSFTGEDTATKKQHVISGGTFYMEREEE